MFGIGNRAIVMIMKTESAIRRLDFKNNHSVTVELPP